MSYRHNPPKDVLSYEIRPGRRCPLVTCGPAPPGWKRKYGTSDERNPDGCLRYPCGKLVPDEYQDEYEFPSDRFSDDNKKPPKRIRPVNYEPFTSHAYHYKIHSDAENKFSFLLGKDFVTAQRLAAQNGVTLRPTIVNGEYQDVDQVYNPKRLNVELAVSLNNHYERTHYYKNIPEVTFNLENSSIIGIGKFG